MAQFGRDGLRAAITLGKSDRTPLK
jgi:hypothetical protein